MDDYSEEDFVEIEPVVVEDTEKAVDFIGPPDDAPTFIFDAAAAAVWIRKSWLRKKNSFYKVVFTPDGMAESRLPMFIRWAGESVSSAFPLRKYQDPVVGYFYCPKEFANLVAANLPGLKEVGIDGGMVVYQPNK